jgi:hypothetical protein
VKASYIKLWELFIICERKLEMRKLLSQNLKKEFFSKCVGEVEVRELFSECEGKLEIRELLSQCERRNSFKM